MLTDIKVLILVPTDTPLKSLTYEDITTFEDLGNRIVFTDKLGAIRVFYTAYIKNYILLPESPNSFKSDAKGESV